MVEDLKKLISDGIKQRLFPGCVIGVRQARTRPLIIAAGAFTYESKSPVVREDTIYDLASITKSIPTGCLALSLIEQGRLSLDDLVINYLPELAMQQRDKITIRHLLTYTAIWDLPRPLASHKKLPPAELLKILYTTDLLCDPGTRHLYTSAPSVILGLILERITNTPLGRLADESFFRPMGMHRTTFKPMQFAPDQVAPTEHDTWRGKLVHRQVHDEAAYTLRALITPGSAGLFSTANDVLIFASMLLSGGVYSNKRYFSEETIALMYTNQLEALGQWAGLGWELNQEHFMGKFRTSQTFGKTGFTGCSLICEPERQIAVVILSNSVHPKRHSSKDRLNVFRRAVADTILAHA